MNVENLNKINQSGNYTIITYDDIQTRNLNSIRIGNYCGKYLTFYDNVFIGDRAGFNANEVEQSILIGYNAGDNINSGSNLIIIGQNNNSNPVNSNSITIGNNYTEHSSISIGIDNYNFGNSNVIIGFNSSNIGNNLISLGNNVINKGSKIFFHNGLKYSNYTNIEFNSNFNLFYNDYKNLYTNVYNSIDNLEEYSCNIQFQKKNLISDFIYPFLKKDCLIIQGEHRVIYNNYVNIPTSPTIVNFNSNQIYNLTNSFTSNLIIPLSIIKRVAIPHINIDTLQIYFNESDGYILNPNQYEIKYLITRNPDYGTFKKNIVDNILFDNNNLIYIANKTFDTINDNCGITPFLIIKKDDNYEYIKGKEKILNFYRNFNNSDVIPDTPISINFSKEILFKTNTINIDVISFDYIYLKNYLLNNLLNINNDEYDKIIISFYELPFNGFISDINRNPINSVNLNNLDNIIYQNYNNKSNDTFKINFSFGYYFANSFYNNLTININIITNNNIIYSDNYIFEDLPLINNIKYTDLSTYVIDYSSSHNIINIQDYYKYLNNKKNFNELTLKLVSTNNNNLLFDNQNFYNFFGSITFKINNNNFISSNIFNFNNDFLKLIDYQFLRYNLSIYDDVIITFDIMPYVKYPYPLITNIFNFNLSFYNDNDLLDSINYNNNNYQLIFNSYNKIIINYSSIHNINNIRFEYFISSNIINNENLKNYITEIYFRNFIVDFSRDNNYNSVAIGNNVSIIGVDNIGIGSNINIIGENSLVIGNDNSKNPIYNSIIIGKKNLTDNYANNIIVIGNSNSTELNTNNQIIIGNNINNKYLLNIDNIICRDDKYLYLGNSNIPVLIGYNSNDVIDYSNMNSLYIRNGINADGYSFNNINNCNIVIKASPLLNSNIIYTLPFLPNDFSRLMLTTDSNGNMKWIETNTFDLNTNLNLNNVITSNLFVRGLISGDGSRLTNVNITDKTTDDLKEGNNNLYYTQERANANILSNISYINSDYIREGNNNLYYTPFRDSNSFYNNIIKITTDDIKEGSNNLYFNNIYLSNAIISTFQNYSTDYFHEGLNNFFFTQDRLNNFIANRTTDDFNEGSNNLFFTSNLALNRIINYINSISTDNIREGSSNLFLTQERIYSNINRILSTKTSDDIKEGTYNLYYNSNTIHSFLNNFFASKTTNDIKEGSNLFLTIDRFNQYISSKTTDNIREGTTNFYLTSNKVINILKTLDSDLVNEGTSNLYYKDEYALIFFMNNLNLLTTDKIKEGTSNKYIINNTYNSNLNVIGNISASNIIINNNNFLDIYYQSVSNLQSNYANTYVKYSNLNNLTINNETSNPLKLVVNITSNKPFTFANVGPPFIIVGNNVGINLYNPSYNLHVNGTAYANYFIGDGYNLSNLNVSNMLITTDDIKIGTSNRFIVNNIYNNNLTINGDLIYNNSIIKGDIIPFTNNIYKIGSSSSYLSNIYSKKIQLGNSYLYENTSNQIALNTTGIYIENNNSNLSINFKNNKLIFSSNNIFDFDLLYNSPIIYNSNYTQTLIYKPLNISSLIINNSCNVSTPFIINNNNNIPIFSIDNRGYIGINTSPINSIFMFNINGALNCSSIYINGLNIYDIVNNNYNNLYFFYYNF